MSELDTTATTTATAVSTAAPPTKFSRDQIREAMLGAANPGELLEIFGVRVRLISPPLSTVLDLQADGDRKAAVAMMMVQYVHTEEGEAVFEEADVEALLAQPFTSDLQKLSSTINKMIGVQPSEEDKS